MKLHVLDASAILTVLQGRPGAARVRGLLDRAAEAAGRLSITVVNWGEVFYVVWRGRGAQAAEEALSQISRLPIEIVDVDRDLSKRAATLKIRFKLPYADCFAAALAQERKAVLVTSDRDFEPLARSVKILWVDTDV